MSTDPELDELDRQLEEHQAIRRSLPNAWNAFFARFGRLRPVQLAVIPHLLAGKDVLLTAPTAGGKTEAVAAPTCEQIVRNRWRGLSALLVTPTRALVNDLYNRLQVPCDQMGIWLGRKTSDHPVADEIREQVLLTTPESTESLLTFRRQALDDLRVVILDEIHLLDGTARGDQLRLVLNRLRAYLKYRRNSELPGLQSVALSATIPDALRTASAYLSRHAQVIQVAGQRNLEARVLLAPGDDRERARQAMEAVADLGDIRKVLVFVNSRKQVDAGTDYYQHDRLAGVPVYGHHGNLSKAEREDTESRFKQATRAICVATMTLEVGIDIGDVDLVVCVDPPFSLASFLQRIGRGCRRMQGKTRVLCVARDRTGELLFEGLVQQARLGIPPIGYVAPLRRSVLVQQVLAYLRQVDGRRRHVEQIMNVFTCTDQPPLERVRIESVLSDMVQSGLLVCRNQIYEPASLGSEFIESSRIYSNIAPAPYEITLVDADTGRTVATAAGLGTDSRGVRIAGRSFDLLAGESGPLRKVRADGDHLTSPRYHARCLAYTADVGASIRNRLHLQPDRLAVIQRGNVTIVFTWLGQLKNLCLAESILALGGCADDRSFALLLSDVRPQQTLDVLRRAIRELARTNPLGNQPLENIVDLGAHFEELTAAGKRHAREDWLDHRYLEVWIDGIKGIHPVDTNTQLGANLLALIDV